MLEVLFAVTGESIAVFEDDELADANSSSSNTAIDAWAKSLAFHASDYGSFKATAHWMTITP